MKGLKKSEKWEYYLYTDGGKSKLVKFPPGTYYAEITNTSGAKLNIGLSVVGYSKASKAYLK